MGELTILLTAGAMASTGPYKALMLAGAALDGGHRVNLFCYGEGVTAIRAKQAPKAFPNIAEMMAALMARGMPVVACRTCCGARGIEEADVVPGAVIGSIAREFMEFVARSDRLLTIGS
jgi:sulfur relay (sulfurtransferase) complex TusBCD TusD component (DsrE family)